MECGPGTGPVATCRVFGLHNKRADEEVGLHNKRADEEVIVVDA